MTLHILSQQNTVLNKFIAEIRDKSIQRDSAAGAVSSGTGCRST